jgi:hypothetical protein
MHSRNINGAKRCAWPYHSGENLKPKTFPNSHRFNGNGNDDSLEQGVRSLEGAVAKSRHDSNLTRKGVER